jgi:catechol 2,3-dioxygenase-like lactoylglutathione lyase family enzyme
MDTSDERPLVWTGHVVAYATDPADAAGFYEALGMRPVAVLPDFAVLELRGGTHLVIRRAEDHVGTQLEWDLMVEDLAATHATWAAAGHEVSAIERGPIHETFVVRDPAGNTLTVFSSHVVGPV